MSTVLFIGNNSGILFIKKASELLKGFVEGTINTFTVVAVDIIGYGRIAASVDTWSTVGGVGVLRALIYGIINTYADVSATLKGFSRRLGQIYTQTILAGTMISQGFLWGAIYTYTTLRGTKPVRWVTEVILKNSFITKILNRNSKIDGD